MQTVTHPGSMQASGEMSLKTAALAGGSVGWSAVPAPQEEFDPRSGVQGQNLGCISFGFRGVYRRQPTDISLSHQCFSLSLKGINIPLFFPTMGAHLNITLSGNLGVSDALCILQ